MDDCLDGIAAGERGSPEWEEDLQDKAEAFADACAANSGEILPYISTSNTARDLDLLRAVLGDSALNYLGYSWGTAIGAEYAELFRSEEHTSELQSLMRISYAVFCLKKKNT